MALTFKKPKYKAIADWVSGGWSVYRVHPTTKQLVNRLKCKSKEEADLMVSVMSSITVTD